MISINQSQRGYALLSVVVVTGILLVIGSATIRLTQTDLRSTAHQAADQRAFYVADAGVQRALAQLDHDYTTASASTSWTYSTTESFRDGTYAVSIEQDPYFPADPTKKQIVSTGTFNGGEAVVRALADVQSSGDCPIALSLGGTAKLVADVATGVPGAASLINGKIYSNQDAKIEVAAGVAIDASPASTIWAVRDLITNDGVNVLSTLDANAYYGRNSIQNGLHVHPFAPLFGTHFANGVGNHGQQQVVPTRSFPLPDYDMIRRDPKTVVINRDNHPFGSWDTATNTWKYSGDIAFPTSPEIIYYVEGNAQIGGIRLAGGTRATIYARGTLVFEKVSLIGAPLGAEVGTTVEIAAGPVGAAASAVAVVSLNSTQKLHLVAEKDLSIGRRILSEVPVSIEANTDLDADSNGVEWQTSASLAFPADDHDSMLDAASGIGLTGVPVANTTEIFGYSVKGSVWAQVASVSALSNEKICLVGQGDATLAMTGTIASQVSQLF